ncbi:hypothetical protein KQI86_05500 [Clostridium sp. MSJ-11]|uniref:Lipoprotein n=1 Tax=Clostridium mobile TaxID=2841512 RepID=A0ABS6EFG8_9CLOT|nr:hypothetical protein [Clostridium mobile]MBU5483778.1 hypothetical protein [Clostridium mobile]
MTSKKSILLVLSIIISLSFAACGAPRKSNEANTRTQNIVSVDNLSPEDTVETALNSLISLDTKNFNKYINYDVKKTNNLIVVKGNKLFGDNLDEEGKELVGSMVSKFSYEVIETKENENEATVKILLTNRDLSDIYERLTSASLAETATNQEVSLIDLINDTDKLLQFEVDLLLKKQDKGWKINMSKEFANAICGGTLPKWQLDFFL